MSTDDIQSERSRSSAEFENDNFTTSTSNAADEIHSFGMEMAAPIIVGFSHFANCSESRVLMVDTSLTPNNSLVTKIFYTNFFCDNVSTGVICASRGGYPVGQWFSSGIPHRNHFIWGFRHFNLWFLAVSLTTCPPVLMS
jgi:hypothetical protein